MKQQTTKPVSESNKSTRKALLEALVKKNVADATPQCGCFGICFAEIDKV